MDFKTFQEKYENKRVKEYNLIEREHPLVSVCVQTYQHVNYIRECLESILIQKTSFPFEILLGEDHSTDGTREICIEYAEKYPNKIRLFFHHRENNIKIGGKATGRFNFLYNLYSSRGKYIALCEGDDYWIDENKLQKQVAILNGNEDYSAVATNSKIMFENSGKELFFSPLKTKTLHVDDFLGARKFHTASILFKNNLEFKTIFTEILSADRLLFLQLSFMKPIRYLNEITCVYRKNNGGLSSKVTSKAMKQDLNFLKYTDDFYLKKNQKIKLFYFISNSILDYSKILYLSDIIYIDLKYLSLNGFNRNSLRFINKSLNEKCRRKLRLL